MRRIVMIMLILILSSQVLAAGVVRDIPGSAGPVETITISIILSETPVDETIVVGELLPEDAVMGSWSIVAADQESISFTEEGRSIIWEFTAAASQVVITYDITLPDRQGEVAFDAVYAMPPDAFGNDRATLRLNGGQAPIQVIPVAESPAPEPVPAPVRGLGVLFLVLIFVMIFVAMLWYFTTRFDEVHTHKDSVAMTEAIGEKFYDVVVKKRVAARTDLPEGFETVPKKAEHTLQHFKEEKEEMIETIDAMESQLPPLAESREELEHLKREILGIRFAQKDV